MRGQRMPTRTGSSIRRGVFLLAALCLAGCVPPPPPPIYSYSPYPSQPYAVSREPLPRRPVSLTGALPVARPACAPQPELTEADKTELFKQFDDWQNGGSLPPRRQVADARPPCAPAEEAP